MHCQNLSKILLIPLCLLLVAGCEKQDSQLTVPGFLVWDRVELINEAREPIVERPAKEGDVLKAGDLILTLDDRRATATLNKAVATRDQLAANLQELIKGSREEEIEQARQNVAKSKSRLKLAGLELKRIEKLRVKNLVSREDLDKAQAEFDIDKAQLEYDQANLSKLVSGTREEQIEQVRHQLEAAEAEVELVKINLQRLQIRAPSAGVLDSLPFQIGEQPQTGSVVAVMLVGKQPYARVHVPEQIRAWVKPGTLADVKVDGVDQVFKARVRSISQSADFTPYYALTKDDRSRLSYLAKIDLLAPEARELSAGVPVNVIFRHDKTDSTTE
ncbi:HlyD family efflux transporter periplasmic adaptor subunit [Thiomicrorhabdus sp. ZW0627]|uniref:HlyD family secretion protein n=1 Tax=Thiomicrorhabdus sp. ZW0627 TaxID=3039774 RepID=UPI002436844A|nr:HlyD family efflux transporter periplasmic adaptor subunit [Thiomicrorhabdus sp. ZW0627]MDG6773831.1 HlyD family efflux transporter periplasmic adaptor subunit [Thiomicrorhabdus sp. ZW0627]